MSTPANPLSPVVQAWDDDQIQFPRLLSELHGLVTELQVAELAESMDLEPADVEELFDRADVAWKQRLDESRAFIDRAVADLQARGLTPTMTGDEAIAMFRDDSKDTP